MKIFLNGSDGRMGQAVIKACSENEVEVSVQATKEDQQLDALAECDVVVDFSHHDATAGLVAAAAQAGKPVVIGTTGHSPSERESILEHTERIAIVWAGNYSVGVNLLLHLTEKVAKILPLAYHPEIVEMHHRHKKDAPSGTAANLVEAILRGRSWEEDTVQNGRAGQTGERPDEEIGVHALRGGEVVGEHTVIFAGPGERLELKHQASDRRIFAEGALVAARWVSDKAAGLYTMQEVLGL